MAKPRKRKPPAPVPLVVPIAPGEKEPGAEPEPPMSLIRTRAVACAIECGLDKDLDVGEPQRVDYPQHGHGYMVTVQERGAKRRMGTARFDAQGRLAYWTLDNRTI